MERIIRTGNEVGGAGNFYNKSWGGAGEAGEKTVNLFSWISNVVKDSCNPRGAGSESPQE